MHRAGGRRRDARRQEVSETGPQESHEAIKGLDMILGLALFLNLTKNNGSG
jgi:hypothetical protein